MTPESFNAACLAYAVESGRQPDRAALEAAFKTLNAYKDRHMADKIGGTDVLVLLMIAASSLLAIRRTYPRDVPKQLDSYVGKLRPLPLLLQLLATLVLRPPTGANRRAEWPL